MANSELILGARGGLHKHVVAETTATTSQTVRDALTNLVTNGGQQLLDALKYHDDTIFLSIYDGKTKFNWTYNVENTTASFIYTNGSNTAGITTDLIRFYFNNGNHIMSSCNIGINNAVTFDSSYTNSNVSSGFAGIWQIYYLD